MDYWKTYQQVVAPVNKYTPTVHKANNSQWVTGCKISNILPCQNSELEQARPCPQLCYIQSRSLQKKCLLMWCLDVNNLFTVTLLACIALRIEEQTVGREYEKGMVLPRPSRFLSLLTLSPAYLPCFYTYVFIHIPIRDNVSTPLRFKEYTQKCQMISYCSHTNILKYRASLFLFLR